MWHQSRPGVPGEPEKGDRFGRALATGDFDGNGFDDLAVGAPYENVFVSDKSIFGEEAGEDEIDAGFVVVLYGSPNGLASAGSDGWDQNSDGVKGKLEDYDYFGWALAAGDFDGDARDDLAIGVPGEGPDVTPERVKYYSGAVQVLYGGANGLTDRDQIWQQGLDGLDDKRETDDWFGGSLAAGNLGYSSKQDDLAIGVVGEDLGSRTNAGGVHVVYGQPGAGLSATTVPDVFLTQDTESVEDNAEGFDRLGWALAIADFGRSPEEDLAVGVPGESVSAGSQGAVQVFYGSSYGVPSGGNELWHEGIAGVEGDPEPKDEFGRSVAVADFDQFSQADLAVSVPLEDIAGAADAGAVHVIHGGPSGLLVDGSVAIADQLWDRTAFGATPTAGELFGLALAAGQLGREGAADLVATAPGVDFADHADGGLAHVLYGRDPAGLAAAGSEAWHQDVAGVEDAVESQDRFGG